MSDLSCAHSPHLKPVILDITIFWNVFQYGDMEELEIVTELPDTCVSVPGTESDFFMHHLCPVR